MGAITIRSIKRFVVYKPIKVFIDYISYHYFFGMSIHNFTTFSLYMTKSYINSRDINHIVIYICSSFGKISLKQVAQYPS